MRALRTAALILLAVSLSACASVQGNGGPQLGAQPVRYGVVTRFDPVELEGDDQLGLGAIIGATAGGVLGHQFGRGTGRDVATVIGAIGGGLASNAVQNRYVDRRPGQHILVQLDNGVTVGVTQPRIPRCASAIACSWKVAASAHGSSGPDPPRTAP